MSEMKCAKVSLAVVYGTLALKRTLKWQLYYGAVNVSLPAGWNPSCVYQLVQYAESTNNLCSEQTVECSCVSLSLIVIAKYVHTYMREYIHTDIGR